MNFHRLLYLMLLMSTLAIGADAADTAAPNTSGQTVNQVYPDLASSALCYAKLESLPDGQVLKSGELAISQKDIEAEIAKAPEAMRPELGKNRFFLLEQLATKELLL